MNEKPVHKYAIYLFLLVYLFVFLRVSEIIRFCFSYLHGNSKSATFKQNQPTNFMKTAGMFFMVCRRASYKKLNRTLREKCLNTEFFLVRIFLYLDWIQENTGQKKLRICTLSRSGY